MAWLVSEQGVEARSGHGPATVLGGERRQPTRAMPVNKVRLSPEASSEGRSCGTLGRNKRPCEKQDKTGALKQ